MNLTDPQNEQGTMLTLDNGRTRYVKLYGCPDCGALISALGVGTHERWHDRTDPLLRAVELDEELRADYLRRP